METISLETAVGYVAAAYIGIWVIFFGYVVALANRLGNLRKQVEALTEAVKQKTTAGDQSKAKI